MVSYNTTGTIGFAVNYIAICSSVFTRLYRHLRQLMYVVVKIIYL